MAQEHGGSAGIDAAAVPLADGGDGARVVEGKHGDVRPERDLMSESTENTGFLTYLCGIIDS